MLVLERYAVTQYVRTASAIAVLQVRSPISVAGSVQLQTWLQRSVQPPGPKLQRFSERQLSQFNYLSLT